MGTDGDGFVYLTAADVERALPDVAGRIRLARRAMTALIADAELPPKVGIHPRQDQSFAHAMPAFVRGAAMDGSADLLGLKWVTGFPGNRAAGLPALNASVLLSDPRTGRPCALLDGGPITAHRTAAVSGVAIETWKPDIGAATLRVTLVGAGVQARSHLPVLGHLLPGSTVVISDRHADRAEALAQEAASLGVFSGVSVEIDPIEAVSGAHVVVTVVSFGPDRQAIPAEAFSAAQLIVAVDYDMCVPASLAAAAQPFVVDERGQFLANRATGIFAGYPDPATTIGEALLTRGDAAWPDGRGPLLHSDAEHHPGTVLVTHLGVGVADLVFADAVLETAARLGLGTSLAA
jgi:ornithine cyclodeaminase